MVKGRWGKLRLSLEKKKYNKLVCGSSKRFNLKVQHIIIFTISVVNLKALQRTPIFFEVYHIDWLE
jgi:hypothetical protein